MKNCLGLATCFYPDSSPERWETAAKAGFTDAEIDTNNRLPAEEICRDSEKIFADLKAGGLTPASFHLPCGTAWDIWAADAGVRVRALEGLESLLQWAGNKGIGTAVLHPSFEPIDSAERADRLAFASESIRTENGLYRPRLFSPHNMRARRRSRSEGRAKALRENDSFGI